MFWDDSYRLIVLGEIWHKNVILFQKKNGESPKREKTKIWIWMPAKTERDVICLKVVVFVSETLNGIDA